MALGHRAEESTDLDERFKLVAMLGKSKMIMNFRACTNIYVITLLSDENAAILVLPVVVSQCTK